MIIDIVHSAAANVGGLMKLADMLGVRHQTFHSWRRIPAERVLEVERLTGIPRHELRPDIYPATFITQDGTRPSSKERAEP